MASFSFVKTLTLVAVLMALLCAVTARADEASCKASCEELETGGKKCSFSYKDNNCKTSCTDESKGCSAGNQSAALPLALMSPARVLGGVVLALAVAAATL